MNNPNSTRAEGRAGETVAANYLKSLGFEIVRRNYTSKYGEIDIIAKDGSTYAFVEVKMRADDEMMLALHGRPIRAVNAKKKERIYLTAKEFIKENSLRGQPARIDVIELYKSVHEGCCSFRIKYFRHVYSGQSKY